MVLPCAVCSRQLVGAEAKLVDELSDQPGGPLAMEFAA